MTFTNTTTENQEPFSFEKLKALMDAMPKPHEFWSWELAPRDKGWCFEDDRAKVTICHPDLWRKAFKEAPESFKPAHHGFGEMQIIEIDGDDDRAKACRARWAAVLKKWADDIETQKVVNKYHTILKPKNPLFTTTPT